MAGQVPELGVPLVDPSEAAQYRPDLSASAPEPYIKELDYEPRYSLVITTLEALDEYLAKGKVGMGIVGTVLVSLTDEAREEARKRNEARIAYEISRRGLPETTTLPQLNEVIDAEHAAMRAADILRIKGQVGKHALSQDQD